MRKGAHRKKSGDRKHGRNTAKCEKYKRLNKHEKSHVTRITKHIDKYSDSSPMAKQALKKYKDLLK